MVVSIGTLRPIFRVSLTENSNGFPRRQVFGNSLTMAMPAGGGAGEMPASRGRPAGGVFCKMQNAVQFAKSRPPAVGRRPPFRLSMRRDPPFLRQQRDGMAVARKRTSLAGASPAPDASREDTAFSEGWGKRPSGRFLQPRGSGAIFLLPLCAPGPPFLSAISRFPQHFALAPPQGAPCPRPSFDARRLRGTAQDEGMD
jgi:hypothetical protein